MLCKSSIKSLSYSLHRVVRSWGSGVRQVQSLLTSYIICIICDLISDSEDQTSDKYLQAHSPMPGTRVVKLHLRSHQQILLNAALCLALTLQGPEMRTGWGDGKSTVCEFSLVKERKIPLQYEVQPQFQKCPQDTEVRQGGHADSEGGCPSSRASGSR